MYDVAANTGWVSVGSDHDTGAFAVESIRRWWDNVGRLAYPKGIKITDRETRDLETQHLTRHDFHGEWNYTVNPTTQP